MQQKVCTGNAVVKPGKLYEVQAHIGERLRPAWPMFTGRVLEPTGNFGPRGMMIENRIRLIPFLGFINI